MTSVETITALIDTAAGIGELERLNTQYDGDRRRARNDYDRVLKERDALRQCVDELTHICEQYREAQNYDMGLGDVLEHNDDLRQRLDAVATLHAAHYFGGEAGTACAQCATGAYPCPTMKAIRGGE